MHFLKVENFPLYAIRSKKFKQYKDRSNGKISNTQDSEFRALIFVHLQVPIKLSERKYKQRGLEHDENLLNELGTKIDWAGIPSKEVILVNPILEAKNNN